MIHIQKRHVVLLAGLMVTLAAGCIGGPRTFSSTHVPATKYVSFEDRSVPVFDIPSASQDSDMSFADVAGIDGEVVNLQQ